MESLITYIMSLRPLTGVQKTEIASHFQAGHYKEGDYLFEGGHVCNKLFFIVSGIVRMVAINDKGVEVTHYFVGENQFCTNLASFNNETVAEDSIECCSPATRTAGDCRSCSTEPPGFLPEYHPPVPEQNSAAVEIVHVAAAFWGANQLHYLPFGNRRLAQFPNLCHKIYEI